MRSLTAVEHRASFSRRTLLRGAVALGATATGRLLHARQMQTYLPPGVAPKPKGPPVFLDYDQQELDFAYDQGPWAPNQPDIAARSARKTAAALERLGPPRRFAYGPTPIETLEVHRTRQPAAPVHIHIHGGTWRTGSAASLGYLAETFVDWGAHFVAVDFTNVNDTRGDLLPLAQQVRRAVAWVYQNADAIDANRQQLFLSGYSSGGHLAAVVLTTDWREFGVPERILAGGLCCSGMYDLYPVSLSSRRSYVSFTRDIIDALSPQRHLSRVNVPVIVAYGTRETPEFQRQNRDFAAALERAGKPVTVIAGEGFNHFEIIETLGDPYGLLGRQALHQMSLMQP
jgi:arylformamidase